MAGLSGLPLEDGSSHLYLLFPGAKHPWGLVDKKCRVKWDQSCH